MNPRVAFFAILSLTLAALASGADQPAPSSAVDGRELDPEKLQQFIDSVEPWIGKYPPHFKDEKHKKVILDATQKVTDDIKTINPDKIQDVKLLTTLAYILAMGHNVDMHTFSEARIFFERALTLDPDNAHANYLFGMFLISTDQYHFDSLPFLQKALQGGERAAHLPIAMLYYQRGDKKEAMVQLKAYSDAFPQDFGAGDLYTAMKNGTLQFGNPQYKKSK